MLLNKFARLKWWQIALLAIVLSAVGGLASGQSSEKDRGLYTKKLEQAPWAPPGWLFGPAWTTINIFLLLGLQQLLVSKIPQRKKLLVLQALIWIVFFSFGYVYFNRKSPLLAAIWTISDAGFAAASFVIAQKANRKLSYYYLPLLAWTMFASTVAVYQAVENPDPVFETPALH
jgi:tryptophan-rich sensory protein